MSDDSSLETPGDPALCRGCDAMWVEGLCRDLPQDVLARLRQIHAPVSLAAAQSLFREGDPGEFLYLVISGSLKLHKLLSDGRRQVVRFLFAGDLFGLDQTEDGLYATSADSLSQCQLCRFPIRKVEKLGDEMIALNGHLNRVVVRDLVVVQNHLLLLGRKSADEKLASFLLEMSERALQRGLPVSPISLPMSRTDIADYLGLTIETVSRTLTRLRQKDLIRLPLSGQVVLADMAKLRDLADGQSL